MFEHVNLRPVVLQQCSCKYCAQNQRATHHSTDEREILWHHVLKVVGDEDASYEHLDGVHLLTIVLEDVGGSGLRNEEDGPERDLTLCREVSLGHRVLTVLGETLVELVVLIVCYVRRSVGQCK